MEPEFREYVIVKNDENEATFKQFKKFGDTYVLHPLKKTSIINHISIQSKI